MSTDSAYLSMTELARRLDLPESTMRYYCKRFAGFLPYKGEGRRRRYARECEKTLVFIASAMHRNKNATAVELLLQAGQFGHASSPAAPAAAQGAALAPEFAQLLVNAMERQAEALGKIAEGLAFFTSRPLGGAERAAAADVASGADEDLRHAVAELKQQIFTAEKVYQEDLEQIRKWLAHIGEAVAKLS